MAPGRSQTESGRLTRLGFSDVARASRLLAAISDAAVPDDVLLSLSRSADPDQALGSLVRIVERHPAPQDLLGQLVVDPHFRQRLISVLGASLALGDHLVRHPLDCDTLIGEELTLSRPTAACLRSVLLTAVGADPLAPEPVATNADEPVLNALRVTYRRRLLQLAARDLAAAFAVDDVAAELADLAAAAVEAALAIARAELPHHSTAVRLAVIGMGKCGGRELNYVSDVDVVYVAEPHPNGDEVGALQSATLLAAALTRACTRSTREGSLWEVDAGLRPEGRSGPLVRTLASHVAYYHRWAKTWEFQALLKARPIAGDLELGRQYVQAMDPYVWSASSRAGFVDDVQHMRRRVEAQIPPALMDRQLKLGPGGLRDVEFSVQLLQLVHGRSDASIRSSNTLQALSALATGGYVGRDDAASLQQAYRFLRTLEHRLQLHRLRRSQIMPARSDDLRRLGRSIGFHKNPVEELTAQWRGHALEVRRLHEKLFYRPLLHAVARLEPGEARLAPEAATARLEALGYTDPSGALRHIEALTAGVSRRATIQQTLLPVMLRWFADAADPDAGLLGFRRVSEALGTTHWYLALLRDAGATAERLAHILGSSQFATDLLLKAPEAVAMLADDDELRPRHSDELRQEMASAARRASDDDAAAGAVRAIRRRELFRLAAADVLGLMDVEDMGRALSELASAALDTVLDTAQRAASKRHDGVCTQIAVIGMGRFGGQELGFGSDLDVLFVHEPLGAANEQAAADFATSVANETRRLLSLPAPDPPMLLDADLRPEGRTGPLVRTLASYSSYYERWSLTWESQALIRAAPVGGDLDLGQRFIALIDPMRWPAGGLDDQAVMDIRRLKARMEAERLPRGVEPALHTKLGPGGLSDIEWTVQLMQLQFGHVHAALRTPRTLPALAAASHAALLTNDEAQILREAWIMATRIRNAIMLARGRADDSLPTSQRDLTSIASLVGYAAGSASELVEDYRRVARRARRVVERVFYK